MSLQAPTRAAPGLPSTCHALPILVIHPPLPWQDTAGKGPLLVPDLLFKHSVCSLEYQLSVFATAAEDTGCTSSYGDTNTTKGRTYPFTQTCHQN